jgi:predicted Zn-dependent protease
LLKSEKDGRIRMNFKALKNVIVVFLFFFALSSRLLLSQTQEDIAYQKADSLQDKQQRTEALKNFISSYPDGQRKVNALISLFSLSLDGNKTGVALTYADQAARSVSEPYRITIYNDVAYQLAQKNICLDTADVYSKRAVNGARENHSRYLGTFLDTRALVMFDLGKADTASELEKEAISAYREDPSFLSNLAIYQEAAGKRIDGLKTAARAILLGNTDEALTNFNNWIVKEKPGVKGQDKLRKDIAESTIKIFLQGQNKEEKYKVNSEAAVFLAFLNVNLKQANKWIKESINSLNNNSSINDRILYTKNYGIILFAEGKYNEALKELTSIKDITDFWDSGYWYILGKTYEKVNKNQEALDAYITGSLLIHYKNIENALNELGAKEGINEGKIKLLVEQKRNEQSAFEPGQYKGRENKNNILLAEIFTGSECPPCVSADYALESLSKYFTRNEVAILEYHVNIPAPDAMTNPDTWKRYVYYGGNFGTPMVIVQGNSRIGGGGPKYMTKNRFNVYRYALEKYLNNKPDVQLNGTVKQVNDSVKIDLRVNKTKTIENNTSINIALVEKSIQYPAGNGVTNHIFVVRSLIKGADGMPIKTAKGNESVSTAFSLNGIEKSLSQYLDDPTKDPSWRKGTQFTEWKKRTDKLDRNNLAIVAWVQNSKTKAVLQSFYLDVPGNK